MPKIGSTVCVCYQLAEEVDDNRRSPTYGEVIKWLPSFKAYAEVLAVNADDTLELAVYDNDPTPRNHSQLLGGISNAKRAADSADRQTVGRWWQE